MSWKEISLPGGYVDDYAAQYVAVINRFWEHYHLKKQPNEILKIDRDYLVRYFVEFRDEVRRGVAEANEVRTVNGEKTQGDIDKAIAAYLDVCASSFVLPAHFSDIQLGRLSTSVNEKKADDPLAEIAVDLVVPEALNLDVDVDELLDWFDFALVLPLHSIFFYSGSRKMGNDT